MITHTKDLLKCCPFLAPLTGHIPMVCLFIMIASMLINFSFPNNPFCGWRNYFLHKPHLTHSSTIKMTINFKATWARQFEKDLMCKEMSKWEGSCLCCVGAHARVLTYLNGCLYNAKIALTPMWFILVKVKKLGCSCE